MFPHAFKVLAEEIGTAISRNARFDAILGEQLYQLGLSNRLAGAVVVAPYVSASFIWLSHCSYPLEGFGALAWRGSLLACGALDSHGSLCVDGVLVVVGSLWFNGALASNGSRSR